MNREERKPVIWRCYMASGHEWSTAHRSATKMESRFFKNNSHEHCKKWLTWGDVFRIVKTNPSPHGIGRFSSDKKRGGWGSELLSWLLQRHSLAFRWENITFKKTSCWHQGAGNWTRSDFPFLYIGLSKKLHASLMRLAFSGGIRYVRFALPILGDGISMPHHCTGSAMSILISHCKKQTLGGWGGRGCGNQN